MKKTLSLIALVSLAGCGYSASVQRPESPTSYWEGNYPSEPTPAPSYRYASEAPVTYAPPSYVPPPPPAIVPAPPSARPDTRSPVGVGFAPVGNGCVNPYQCPTWVTTPVYVTGGVLAPVTAASDSSETVTVAPSRRAPMAHGHQPAVGPSATSGSQAISAEDRLTKVERKVHALAELAKRNVNVTESWCKGFLKNPSASGLETADLDGAKANCQDIVGQK